MKKLIILDRDGVINYDSEEYIKSPAEWIPIPGSLEAIAKLNKAGYLVAVATNQSGVARGLFTEHTLHQIHEKMHNALRELGGQIDAIFYCPHGPKDGCNCRKPEPGLLLAIADKFHCSLDHVPAIGDSLRDLEAALAVGCTPILVTSGKGIDLENKLLFQNDILVFPNLSNAVDKLFLALS